MIREVRKRRKRRTMREKKGGGKRKELEGWWKSEKRLRGWKRVMVKGGELERGKEEEGARKK